MWPMLQQLLEYDLLRASNHLVWLLLLLGPWLLTTTMMMMILMLIVPFVQMLLIDVIVQLLM
jgi:hypothetical protein